MVKSQKLTYFVVIMTIVLLFYIMITKPFHNYKSVHIQGGNKDVLQIRAKASWFSKHPEPVQTIKYKHEELAKNETRIDGGESVWDNLLDLKYWDSFSYDDESEFNLEEYWTEETYENRENKAKQLTSIDVMNRSTVDLSCPQRKPVIVTDDGRRQVPKELYNMAAQVR